MTLDKETKALLDEMGVGEAEFMKRLASLWSEQTVEQEWYENEHKPRKENDHADLR